MRIIQIQGLMARCEAKGVECDANLLMLEREELAVGDYVVIHLGYAIESVSLEHAEEAWTLYDEILAAASKAFPLGDRAGDCKRVAKERRSAQGCQQACGLRRSEQWKLKPGRVDTRSASNTRAQRASLRLAEPSRPGAKAQRSCKSCANWRGT
ncbi:MAG: hypothetical protein N838_34395 [Thiohalocapsa sp. PB-PSB1]|nr:MAG: hypothetical protein N838_34395 [Thiohalocapsa sp. PB-PSB1]